MEYSVNNNDDHEASDGGVYIDLGSIPLDINDDDAYINSNQLLESQSIDTTLNEWRANHWVVLIDDEPAIRLAIGDYLHAMGYSVLTACDGPMAFLEVLLWSCSWSLSKKDNENGGDQEQEAPPWMVDGGSHEWRLPNCVISDIRMPGGIDGVQLLELLRRPPAVDKNVENDVKPTKKKSGRSKKADASSVYDGKDDFELLDAIIVGDNDGKKERITTPSDQAIQYLDTIRGCIDYFIDEEQLNDGQGQQHQQYPTSVQQIPVILLTAKAMVSDRVVGYEAGANGYIPKPFRPEELLGMVDNLMRKQERERHINFIDTQNIEEVDDHANNDIQDLDPEEAKVITEELIEIKKLFQEMVERHETEREQNDHEALQLLLPEAMWMFRNEELRKKVFTKEHIRSILFFCFGIDLPKKNSRNVMLEELEEQSAKHPEKFVCE